MAREYDHLFKVILVGDSDVGKSSLLVRFAENFPAGAPVAVADFIARIVDVDGERVKLQAWDTAGQQNFCAITSSYYRGACGVIVMYDVTNRNSFANVRRWLNDIDNNCKVIDKVLVGNRSDSSERKVVLTEDAQTFAQETGLQLFEISDSNSVQVKDVFMSLARKMLHTKRAKQTTAAKK